MHILCISYKCWKAQRKSSTHNTLHEACTYSHAVSTAMGESGMESHRFVNGMALPQWKLCYNGNCISHVVDLTSGGLMVTLPSSIVLTKGLCSILPLISYFKIDMQGSFLFTCKIFLKLTALKLTKVLITTYHVTYIVWKVFYSSIMVVYHKVFHMLYREILISFSRKAATFYMTLQTDPFSPHVSC